MNQKPKLRYVDVFPVDTEKGKMLALRDPAGIANEIILLTEPALFILQFFDGKNTVKDVIAMIKSQADWDVPAETLNGLIEQLDTNLFLDNEHFRSTKIQLEDELRNAKVRPAQHAGNSYPQNPQLLSETLQQFFENSNGAGLPDRINGTPTPAGLIAPHIDLRIGGATYSHAYRKLAESPPADVYVIIGTGHAGLQHAYSVLPVDFETPLGLAETDKSFIKNLQKNTEFDYYSEVLPHKTEHTVEFQVVFLQHLLKGKKFKIVPVLASFGYQMFEHPYFVQDKKYIADFTSALKKTIEEYPGKVTVIASVDLAHVGPRYGDPNVPDADFLQQVETADRNALEHVKKLDAEGWYKEIAAIDDKYRICGFAPIYTMLKAINASNVDVLQYDRGLMDDNQSVVSYCSAVLY